MQDRLSEVSPQLIKYGDFEPANFFSLTHKLIKVIILSIVLVVLY